MTTPHRVCFQLQVRPDLLDEYLQRHSPVWPEMLAEIAAAGRRNYSLFLGESEPAEEPPPPHAVRAMADAPAIAVNAPRFQSCAVVSFISSSLDGRAALITHLKRFR